MKTVKILALSLVVLLGVVMIASGDNVMAQAEQVQSGLNVIGGGNSASAESTLETIVNTLLFIIGALAVIMIVYGGFRYVTSAGEASAVNAAKNTILYAVVGLVVAICAYAIANFVIGVFTPPEQTNAGENAPAPGGRPGQKIMP